jgi:hypothetical protein
MAPIFLSFYLPIHWFFGLQFCNVANVMIIYRLIKPNLTINVIWKSKFLTIFLSLLLPIGNKYINLANFNFDFLNSGFWKTQNPIYFYIWILILGIISSSKEEVALWSKFRGSTSSTDSHMYETTSKHILTFFNTFHYNIKVQLHIQ